MSLASRRVVRDTTQVIQTNKAFLEEQGIYYIPSEEYKDKGIALLVGKSGTPYCGGYYFFSIEFPTDYPFSPIKVLSLTQDGLTRFNPNMYVQGKVCLSILNTWHDGPQWSGVQSLESVLLAIMSDVLTENPLENEPAYKNCGKSADALTYNRLVWYANVNTAIYGMLTNPPLHAIPFQMILWAEWETNKETVLQQVKACLQMDGTKEMSRAFGFGHQYNFKGLLEKLSCKNLKSTDVQSV